MHQIGAFPALVVIAAMEAGRINTMLPALTIMIVQARKLPKDESFISA